MWGMQLPVQSQSRIFVDEWELSAGPPEVLAVAQAAENAGAFSVAVCDHVAIPNDLTATMGDVWYDTVATLGWLAGQTTSVHLLSHVAVLPYRHPLVTAKAWGTLDLLSGGRAVLGVGAGHVAKEFELLGHDFATRGRALDMAIDEARATWATESIHGAVVAPGPARAGGPPIWVGGSSERARRRAARRGDGWLPRGPPEGGMRAAIDSIRAERLRHHGEELPIDIGGFCEPLHIGAPAGWLPPHTLAVGPDQMAERLAKFRRNGVSHLMVRFPTRSVDELVEQVTRFGVEVWPGV